jgi:hypothetical protein
VLLFAAPTNSIQWTLSAESVTTAIEMMNPHPSATLKKQAYVATALYKSLLEAAPAAV